MWTVIWHIKGRKRPFIDSMKFSEVIEAETYAEIESSREVESYEIAWING